jgi:hypothetical protein
MKEHNRQRFAYLKIGLVLILLLLFSGCVVFPGTVKPNQPYVTVRYYPENFFENELLEFRLDVLRFHHTDECFECLTIGEALLDLLKEDFADDVAQGTITYRAVNSEYFENKPLLMKYGVMEEDFVTHLISQDQDLIQQHHDLWLIAQNDEELRLALKEIIQSLLNQLQ